MNLMTILLQATAPAAAPAAPAAAPAAAAAAAAAAPATAAAAPATTAAKATATAATETANGGSYQFLIMMVLIFAVMYLFMIRPQQKRQKELNNFRKSLEKGQKVITAGGLYGVIKEVKETVVLVEVDTNVVMRVDKSMVMRDTSDIVADQKK